MTGLQQLRNDPGFANQVEQTEARSWIDLTSDAGPDRDIRHEIIDGTIVIIDHSPRRYMNRVLLLGIEHPARPETIDKIIETYKAAGVKGFSVHLSPVARPTSVSRMLTSRGMQRLFQEAVIARSTDDVPPPDPYFRIRRATIEDEETYVDLVMRSSNASEHWARLVAHRVHSDGWRHYIAYDGATPYAVGGLRSHGDVAWIPPAFTLPEYRNRGTQSAMIAHTLREARALGCLWATTYYIATSGHRTRNFERIGFELVYMRPRYGWGEPES